MAQQRLQLSSSALDFTKSLADTSVGDSLFEAGKAYYEWLVRERVDKKHFDKCRELAASLKLYPNEAGCVLQTNIDAADRKLLSRFKTTSFHLVVSGSVGRLIGREFDTMYMMTTVATLVHHHHPDFATSVFCNMMLDEGGHEDGPNYQYAAVRTPIQTVLSKIIESIYFNVCNAGQRLPGLPQALQHLHPHLLNEVHFASIVMGIQKSTEDVVIQSRHFLADLTLWLYYHFDGIVEVIVKNVVVFGPAVRGKLKRRITLLVDTVCSEPGLSCGKVSGEVRASLSVGNGLRTIVKGEDETDIKVASFERHPLYDLDHIPVLANTNQRQGDWVLGRNDINAINHAAKKVMRWMLNVTVLSASSRLDLDYSIDPQDTQHKGMCTVEDLFPHLPRLVHTNTGDMPQSGPIFRYTDISHKKPDADSILSWFPILQDIMNALQVRCPCQACNDKQRLFSCKPGCLRQSGISRFLVLIAHGIADATGATDVSGLTLAEHCMEATIDVFHELVQNHRITWKMIFALSAGITAGFASRGIQQALREDSSATEGSSALAAVQCGSFVAIAAWLNFNERYHDCKPFALKFEEGTIKGVHDTIALITCEASDSLNEKPPLTAYMSYSDETADAEALASESGSASLMTDLSCANFVDDADTELMTTIFRSSERVYRFMTMVRSRKYLRIVDPGTAVRSAFLSSFLECAHRDNRDSNVHLARAKVYDFQAVMSDWRHMGPDGEIQVTSILDDTIKVNTILSISPDGCALRDVGKCCLSCAAEATMRLSPSDTCRLVMFQDSDGQLLKKEM